jgi:uncharacterized protein (DUF1778 family)
LTLSGFNPYAAKKKEKIIMSSEPIRSSHIKARIAPDDLAIIKRAAELQGRSVNDFVVSAVQEAAYRTIEETGTIHLSAEDQRRFADLLLNPSPPPPALTRAKEAHDQLFGSQ